MLFRDLAYRKNSKRLLSICGDLINEYQKHEHKPSCRDDVLELIKNRVSSAKDEISKWKDYKTDYLRISHSLIVNAAFDLLASGKYHIHTGVLNPMSCSDNLMDVYKAGMEFAEKRHEIDEKTRIEQYDYLIKCISEVG